MRKKFIHIAGSILIGTLIGIYISYQLENYTDDNKKKYKGVCLFDIDNTLTNGTENELVVKQCLDEGYAVGISTANPYYTPHTIRFFKWMPNNLYQFMVQNNFDTFNNVSSLYLNGKIEKDKYDEIDSQIYSSTINVYGWRKCFSLISTAKLYEIEDLKKVFLFDDDKGYINGALSFNDKVNIIRIDNNDPSYFLNAINVKLALKNSNF